MAMTPDFVRKRIERLKKIPNWIERVYGDEVSVFKKLYISADLFISMLVVGNHIEDYFKYEFYNLNYQGRKNYVTIGRLKRFVDISNDNDLSMIFHDKEKFDEKFKCYIGREALNMRNVTSDEFIAFALRHGEVFIKPIYGSYGIGAQKRKCKGVEDAKRIFEEFAGTDTVIEEVIKQNKEMEEFNDTSLNSVRIVTYVRADGTPCIMPGAVIRLGRKGEVADNFHNGGITAQIDIETGVVCSTGIDQKGNRYILHPDSKKMIIGFQVPMWDQIRKTVLETAMVIPQVRYVGWDVAITDDGRILLIEGNNQADPDVGQMSDGIGKWKVFAKYMNEVKCKAK